MRLKPNPFINKGMDFREKTEKIIVTFFVEKKAEFNEAFKKQMGSVQISY